MVFRLRPAGLPDQKDDVFSLQNKNTFGVKCSRVKQRNYPEPKYRILVSINFLPFIGYCDRPLWPMIIRVRSCNRLSNA